MKHALLSVGCILLMGLSWNVGADEAIGYKDIRLGMTVEEVSNLNVCGEDYDKRMGDWDYWGRHFKEREGGRACYGKRDWSWTLVFCNSTACHFGAEEPSWAGHGVVGPNALHKTKAKILPGILSIIAINIGAYTPSSYKNTFSILEKKYGLDWVFSEAQLEQMNSAPGSKKRVYSAFNGETIYLSIRYSKYAQSDPAKRWETDMWISYSTKRNGRGIASKYKPKDETF